MMDNQYIEVDCLAVSQPIGTFYVCVMSFGDLLEIARADIRKLVGSESNDNYMGIQRVVSPSRVKEIAAYVNTMDATFPTSITLAISDLNEDGESVGNFILNESTRKARIKKDPGVAKVLDGQHRIEGLKVGSQLFDQNVNFQLNVTIFVDADLDDQAQIFSVINKAQTKVNKSLVFDLYEYSRHRSPQKTAHDVVRLLNRSKKSPFYSKVKILGTSRDPAAESIAQATLAESIMKYISIDPASDRDLIKRDRPILSLFRSQSRDLDSKKLIFRKFFLDDEDHRIVDILVTLFAQAKSVWPLSWDTKDGQVLSKSTGVIALMRFLPHAFNNSYHAGIEEFGEYVREAMENTGIPDLGFTRDRFNPGATGSKTLFDALIQASPAAVNGLSGQSLNLFGEDV